MLLWTCSWSISGFQSRWRVITPSLLSNNKRCVSWSSSWMASRKVVWLDVHFLDVKPEVQSSANTSYCKCNASSSVEAPLNKPTQKSLWSTWVALGCSFWLSSAVSSQRVWPGRVLMRSHRWLLWVCSWMGSFVCLPRILCTFWSCGQTTKWQYIFAVSTLKQIWWVLKRSTKD